MSTAVKKFVENLLSQAEIALNGSNPWDVRVNNDRFYTRTLRGSLGFGESYMDGDWDVQSIDALFRRIIRMDITRSPMVIINRLLLDLKSRLTNLQTRIGSRAIAETHYDLDHRLYELFLGPYTGISISKEQVAYARDYTAGLPVEIIDCDYRDLPQRFEPGHFDKVVIIGMIEHVGYKNYRKIFEIVHRAIKDDGVFLLHTIGNNRATTVVDPWIEKYIFRNSMAPAMAQLAQSLEGLFTVHDWENYGHYYPPTLANWQARFEANWPQIEAIETANRFDEKFRRMFNYYFLSCKAGFETEHMYLWHLVMSKEGMGRSVYPRVNLLT
jgi:cyclopropane-fatty-acyl-phospholipid synthase